MRRFLASWDLDLLEEMAALRRGHPGLDPSLVLRAATLGGAEALGLDDRLGSLAPGRRAALLSVRLEAGDDPLEAVTSGPHPSSREVVRAPLS